MEFFSVSEDSLVSPQEESKVREDIVHLWVEVVREILAARALKILQKQISNIWPSLQIQG